MDTNNGGTSFEPNRHKTAAEIAREKVLAVYSSTVDSMKKLSVEGDAGGNGYGEGAGYGYGGNSVNYDGNQYVTPPAPGAFGGYAGAAGQGYGDVAGQSYGGAGKYGGEYNDGYTRSAAYGNVDDSYYAKRDDGADDYEEREGYAESYDAGGERYDSGYNAGYEASGAGYDAGNAGYGVGNAYSAGYEAGGEREPDVSTNNSAGYDVGDETSALKDAPINQTAVSEEWQKYHSAWQNYYQNYYNDYYSKAAQNYLEAEKLKNERVASGKVRKKRHIKHLVPVLALVVVILTTLFLQYNRLIFAPIMAYVSPNSDTAPTSIEAVDPNVAGTVTADPRLIIPKINVDVPVWFDIPYTEAAAAMLKGVAQFKIPGASALPGEIGNLVISGHSAGDIYSGNQYKFIFSGLERLEPGDLIYINYNSVRYTYQMTKNEVVEPSNVAALVYETSKPVLTLITCTPLGTSRYRLLVTAEQISPTYDGNTPSTDPIEVEDSGISMPANEPSFFERLFGN